jgi:hypothetical protein
MFVDFQRTTWRCIPDDGGLHNTLMLYVMSLFICLTMLLTVQIMCGVEYREDKL